MIVVDDGSARPIPGAIRRERCGGPAAARNTGLEHATTELVAFLDADTLPPPDWIERLAGHFDDPRVKAVAPRIRAANRRRSPLDLGPDRTVTDPFGGLGDLLFTPLARWDSVWYLSIANLGYGGDDSPRTAFFPLFPLLSRGVGELGGGSEAAVLVGSYVVALGALGVALYLLHRLTELELGRAAAGPAVLLLCVFPASVFLGAPYSESLFLAASVGAFYGARPGHWAAAGVQAVRLGGTLQPPPGVLEPPGSLKGDLNDLTETITSHLAEVNRCHCAGVDPNPRIWCVYELDACADPGR